MRMRTTIDIPDRIYRKLKSRAESEGTSTKELILRGAKSVLKESAHKPRKRIELPIIRSKQPGTLVVDNDKIFEIIPFT